MFDFLSKPTILWTLGDHLMAFLLVVILIAIGFFSVLIFNTIKYKFRRGKIKKW